MRRVRDFLAVVMVGLLLLAAPIAAQGQQDIPVGTVAVYVMRWDGTEVVPVGDPIIVLPPAAPVCLPDGAA